MSELPGHAATGVSPSAVAPCEAAGLSTARKSKKPTAEAGVPNKTDLILKKLKLARGATLQQLMDVTGWQKHSVRGFLSGTVRKKLGLELVSEEGKDGLRRYRIIEAAS